MLVTAVCLERNIEIELPQSRFRDRVYTEGDVEGCGTDKRVVGVIVFDLFALSLVFA